MQEEFLLHKAVIKQQPKAVQFLLKKQCNPNQPCDDNGQTPMHYAVMYYEPFVFSYLIEHEGNPRAQNNSGLTPVDMFLLYPPDNGEHKEALLHYFKKKCPDLLAGKENQLESLQLKTRRFFRK